MHLIVAGETKKMTIGLNFLPDAHQPRHRKGTTKVKVAAVKVGSTTVSYVLASNLERPIRRESVVLNLLGRGDDGARILTQIINGWLNDVPPDRLLVVGGQALREQAWGEIVAGHRVWVLAGTEEAQLTHFAVAALTNSTAAATIFDIGGGSTEIIGRAHIYSLPVGVGRPESLETNVWPDLPVLGHAWMVGGTAHAISRLLGRGPLEAISTESVLRLQRDDGALTVERLLARGVPPDRVPLLRPGLRILTALLVRYHLSEFFWSPFGLLEGAWLAASLGRGRDFRDGY